MSLGHSRCSSSDAPAPQAFEHRLYTLAGQAVRYFAVAAATLCAIALHLVVLGLPAGTESDAHYPISLIHTPTVWVAIFIYFAMAALALFGLSFGHRVLTMTACALTPTGAMFAFLALWTGSLWYKASWGIWWMWDAHLTSLLLVLLIMLGCVAVHGVVDDFRRADRTASTLAVLSVAGVAIVHAGLWLWGVPPLMPVSIPAFQGTTDMAFASTLLMTVGLTAYAFAAVLMRLRVVLLQRGRKSSWVSQLSGDVP